MTTDKTPATLATAKHGGCTQLATVPYDRARELIGDAYNAGTHGIGYSQQIMELHDAVFAAQPSPAGQVDAWAIKLARESAFAHSNEHAYLPQTRQEANRWQPHEWVVAAIQAAALGAPQPVGEPVDDDAASEAFGEFADDYLTDGNGYAPASTYEACSKAFTAAWPDRVAATAAARAELKRLHGDDRTVGARRAEALNRADARDDAEDDAPPAQTVDLAMPIAMIDQALGHLSTALDDLDSSPDPRPGAMVTEAMACLRQTLTGVPNG